MIIIIIIIVYDAFIFIFNHSLRCCQYKKKIKDNFSYHSNNSERGQSVLYFFIHSDSILRIRIVSAIAYSIFIHLTFFLILFLDIENEKKQEKKL